MLDSRLDEIDSLLDRFHHFGVRLGLERIRELLDTLGNPQQRVPVIHVAGTNGKGSVCAYLSAVLTAAGYRVGRYTSPHLVSWCERITLNEVPIAPSALLDLLTKVTAVIHNQNSEDPPTQFEVITATAWLYFAQQAVDVAIVEVGLGGRLDATNVCDRPLVSVITSLGYDHCQHLGDTLGEIAFEKAGILKPACPAAIAPLPPEAAPVVKARLQELGCPCTIVNPALDLGEGRCRYVESDFLLEYRLPLLGQVQRTNSALAIAALQWLRWQGWSLSDEAIAQGIAQARWPGRLQRVTWQGMPLLIDGAHNPDGALALRKFLDDADASTETASDPGRDRYWIIGLMANKDHRQILATLLRPNDRCYFVPIPDHATADPTELCEIARQIYPDLASCRVYPSVLAALDQITNQLPDQVPDQVTASIPIQNHTTQNDTEVATQSQPLIILGGSLYLIGHLFQACPNLLCSGWPSSQPETSSDS